MQDPSPYDSGTTEEEEQYLLPLRYVYRFQFGDGTRKDFEIELDRRTLELIPPYNRPKPNWTRLKYSQCANCPLPDDVAYCPVAVNLSNLVEAFKDAYSYEHTHVTVEVPERTYENQTTIQKGLSSILGIYMVTSNCPIMDHLRPMVRFHLPFASSNETVYRAVSMYLTRQYFIWRNGGRPDWELKELDQLYKAVAEVNRGMSERLRNASTADANVNAVIILFTLGELVDHSLEHGLVEIERLFREGQL
jgi:hypothetical protein